MQGTGVEANGSSISDAAVPLAVGSQALRDGTPTIQLGDAMRETPAADHIILHGDEYDSGAGTVTIQSAQNAPSQSNGADNITIHGPGDASSPSGVGLGVAAGAVGAAALHDAATTDEAAQPLAQQEQVPYKLEGSEQFGITVRLESIPSGAQVMVDEQVVGMTPVQVRMDPRADHIVEFNYDGCGDYVRLLSSTSWREGRDTTVQVQLYCD
jgi:hypothetical protein